MPYKVYKKKIVEKRKKETNFEKKSTFLYREVKKIDVEIKYKHCVMDEQES